MNTANLNTPLIAISVLTVLVGLIWGIKTVQTNAEQKAAANFAPPPSAVNVFTVEKQNWSRSLSSVGTVRAEEGITVLAEVAGRVENIHFRSGDTVEAGSLLLEQDSGNEFAQLASAKARLRLAESNYERIARLRKQKTVSESQFESAKQELDSAIAEVKDLESSLEKKKIRAPFSGRLGIRKVDLGEDLQVGTPIVALQAHDSLNVNFTIPQRWLSLVQPGLDVHVNMIEIKDTIVSGKINAVGAEVNEITRNIEVQARLENADGALVPGMAVEVRVAIPESREHIVVPSTAVVYAPFGDTVFVVEKNEETGQLHARQQFIKIAQRRGDFVSIEAGLSGGERVASSGAFKLFNGQNVVISDQEETVYSLNPQPNDT